MAPVVTVRAPARAELGHLPEIERAAARLFAPYGLDGLYTQHVCTLAQLEAARAADRLRVVALDDGPPLGFALLVSLGPWAQLAELDVLPEFGGQGLGTRLLLEAIEWARARRPGLVLSTMRGPPWNAPFYAKHGFREVTKLDPSMRKIRAAEARLGFPMAERVVMQRLFP
ncbi:MAG: GNAT family N-acetyltransferase [Myxococcota bacterium]